MTKSSDSHLQFLPYLRFRPSHFSKWLDHIESPKNEMEALLKAIKNNDEETFFDILDKTNPKNGKIEFVLQEFLHTDFPSSSEILMESEPVSYSHDKNWSAPLIMAIMFDRGLFTNALIPLSEEKGLKEAANLAALIGSSSMLASIINQADIKNIYGVATAAIRNGHAKCLEVLVDKIDKDELDQQLRIIRQQARMPMVDSIFHAFSLRQKYVENATSSITRQGL